ncbi:hypothetical protein LTR72_012276, partial [Exophiala xenobiotica]
AALDITPIAENTINDSVTGTPIDLPAPIRPRTNVSCKESSASYLLGKLASFWAEKSKKSKDKILEENEYSESDLTSPPLLAGLHPKLIPLDEQLPDKSIAIGWLTTFLRGPNVLLRVCNEAESWSLLDLIYAKGYISHGSKCSIWLQLATGCRYTTGTTPENYTTLFESGWQYLEWCIEQAEEVAPLWLVPPMLLKCLYHMDTKPRSCWLTLGAAIRLVHVNNLDLGIQDSPMFSEEEFGRWQEIWRAMITFDTYEIPHPTNTLYLST